MGSPAPRISRPQRLRNSSHHVAGTSRYDRYVSGSCWKKISPIQGMSDSSGTSHTRNGVIVLETYATPNIDVSPSARNRTTRPVANWFAPRESTKNASTSAIDAPASAPPRAPIHGLPVCAGASA